MDIVIRRNIYPIKDFPIFLHEARNEFEHLINKEGTSVGVSFANFEFLKTLSVGSFGRVFLARLKKDNTIHAVKVLKKSIIVKFKQTIHATNEKRILQTLNFPFTICLNYAFLDNSYIYFALTYVNCGDMFEHLKNKHRFEESLSKFYAAQVVLAIEYLHYCNMVYRNLKPENILIDDKGYLKLTDFSFCKVIKGRTYTLCGTPEYLAPEIISNKAYGKAVDWWAFGVLLYEMTAGYPPFHAHDPMKTYENIIEEHYKFPNYFSNDLKELIRNFLQADISKRYGNLKNGVNDVMNHRWFRNIPWVPLLNFKVEAQCVPILSNELDTKYFKSYKEVTFKVAPVDRFPDEFKEF